MPREARERELAVLGHRVHARVREGFPWLVLMHGLGGSAALFDEAFATPHLAGAGLVAVDLIGFGGSDKPPDFDYGLDAQARHLLALLDALGIDHAALVGHSMGGLVATLAAWEQTSRVLALSLLEMNLTERDSVWTLHVTRESEDEYRATFARLVRGADRFARESLARRDPAAVERVAGALRQTTAEAVHRTARSIVATLRGGILRRFLSLPVPRDYFVGSRTLARRSPPFDPAAYGIRVREIPDAGHLMMLDNPDAFYRTLALTVGLEQLGRR